MIPDCQWRVWRRGSTLTNYWQFAGKYHVLPGSEARKTMDSHFVTTNRTGEDLGLPTVPDWWNRMNGHGFFWYDTGQNHLMNDATFRNCGYRSAEYSEYDSSPDRGCGDEDANGCHEDSVVFGLLSHSDQYTPELMQATRRISFDNCGRRFDLSRWDEDQYPSSVSGRNQNWIDADGTVSGLNEPTLIGSGLEDVESWWQVESDGTCFLLDMFINCKFFFS